MIKDSLCQRRSADVTQADKENTDHKAKLIFCVRLPNSQAEDLVMDFDLESAFWLERAS